MEAILNITNGDSAVSVMKAAGIAGRFLPWRDVLHDGPVPAGLTLEKLSEVRAQFIIDQGWGEPKDIIKDFSERDSALRSSNNYAKVILWFEHDLYDQLQLLQILDWFADTPPETTKPSIICTDQYLGTASPGQIQELSHREEIVTEKHLLLAKKAWAVFRSPSPEEWQQLLHEDTFVLPFLDGAILRLLEEYPECQSGLSRTAQKALSIIEKGEKRPEKIFCKYQDTEERLFLGDSGFWIILQQLSASNPPLLELQPGKQLGLPAGPDQELSITPAGKKVLAGQWNWLDMIELDRWLGGVHLTRRNVWCWNTGASILKKRA